MSDFIIQEDYQAHIRQNRLDAVIELDTEMLGSAEKRAIKTMRSHLNARYDVVQIFDKRGDERDVEILGYCIDITLYFLYRIINPRKVPSYRKEAYDEAKIWLEDVKDGSIVPEDLPLVVNDTGENTKAELRMGSLPKRINHV